MSAPTTLTRVLFTSPRVHIYPIPPLKSITAGHRAADWGVDKETSKIFTARLRIIETTTIPTASTSSFSDDEDEKRIITIDVRLEDPDSGELFANCPYVAGVTCVDPVLDSSRFFAVRVVDGPRKAFLGVGFEDRGTAFDFGVCLQEVRRQNGFDAVSKGSNGHGKSVPANTVAADTNATQKKDYSLKEGETIKITIGNKGRRRISSPPAPAAQSNGTLPLPFLPPPPSADEEKKRRRESYKLQDPASQALSEWARAQDWGAFESAPVASSTENRDAKGLGFDDDPFGDFV